MFYLIKFILLNQYRESLLAALSFEYAHVVGNDQLYKFLSFLNKGSGTFKVILAYFRRRFNLFSVFAYYKYNKWH